MNKHSRYINDLDQLKSLGNYRQLPNENRVLYDLCSNDYLGINHDDKLYSEFTDKYLSKQLKFGASSSRLLSLNADNHQKLEQYIAGIYRKEAALLFNSGYHANIGILSALTGKNDLIIADKLVHASIIDGAKLSQADFIRFKHLDYAHLNSLLQKHRYQYEHVFIVSESIFSMDGDVANIQELVEIKNRHNCFLYIDEAHGLGVRGQSGLGCVEEQGCIKDVDLIVGALGKAMASVGAFVTCSGIFKEYLVNYARSFIFSTGLPPINIAWSQHIFELLPHFHERREKLKALSKNFSKPLGLKPMSHIIPYIVEENDVAISLSIKLKEHGYNALPVRFPTVPRGTARLRFSLCAHMNIDELILIKNIIQEHEPVLD